MTKFLGETNWNAIVADESLDIEDERSFIEYLRRIGFAGNDYLSLPVVRLQKYIKEWRNK